MKNKIILMLCLVLAMYACENDDSSNNGDANETPSNFQENFGTQISRDFIGNVIDSNNNPIENAIITIGNEQVQTDNNGVFIFKDAEVNTRFAYIKAEKTGYIHGSRSVMPSKGTNKVSIMLLEETVAGSTNSGESKTIAIANGASVNLEGDYIKEDGTVYSGSLDVIIHHLDPTDDNVALQMPGMLYAENDEGNERMLKTLGMLAVELKGSGGEDLNLAPRSTAEIKIPVDASLLASAPNTIPLWYFDEDKGYWIEEGEATLIGNTYVGTVEHFSFWNCDIPAEAINLCVTVINSDESPFANTKVTITSNTFGTRSGYTDQLGDVCGLIPSGETLEINVYNYAICGSNVIYTATVGPYSTDDFLTVIINDTSSIISETVTGSYTDCNENSITNGYVILNYGDQQFYETVSNGEFTINMLRCATETNFSIEAVDQDNLQTTGAINYTFNTPETNLGNLTSCNTITEFIQYNIDGDSGDQVLFVSDIQATFDETDSNTGSNGKALNISGRGDGTANGCFYLFGTLNDAPYIGTYDNLDYQVVNDTGINIGECIGISQTNNNIIYNVTALGNVGEYIDINFSGTYEDYNGNPHSITGVIHVIRD